MNREAHAVAEKAALTLSRSAGWIRVDSSSKVTLSLWGTFHSPNERSSIASASVSTFHDQSATPAALTARRSSWVSHSGSSSSVICVSSVWAAIGENQSEVRKAHFAGTWDAEHLSVGSFDNRHQVIDGSSFATGA